MTSTHPEQATDEQVEQLARGLAGAAHINPQRTAPPWDQLTPEQQDQHRSEARRSSSAEEER
ncbi:MULTISPECIES: hypothetical protein [unclassified Streptomyces]|uniref:hypothetical protein n=1 Tax=unclassified Streptomyces TaxID=2593676 RepID=UPI0008850ECF|nr:MULTISPECIES: hypothetical protein [unclassified Streptomyces]PBC72297.1 hypothetical protein BX261_7381 [Streptomyces sp. 2321.6]SDR62264.1 hypothetical protein SAMN05216511_7322 [Streptomyces sp. KS_16]SEE51437.1 hypothetical protein SAMN05428940_7371 [Streptomyces sp. 2133.1]SNC77801.1 hypothetical protein SAMN06272741_7217 [Streptomyces sp. 2114.4]